MHDEVVVFIGAGEKIERLRDSTVYWLSRTFQSVFVSERRIMSADNCWKDCMLGI